MEHRIDRHITKLIALELRQSKDEYEEYFNSPHEGFALLYEEVCEAKMEFDMLQDELKRIWGDIMEEYNDIDHLYGALRNAKCLVSEAVQTAAMLEKYIESAEENGW